MPHLRKLPPAYADEWALELAPFVLERLLEHLVGDDRVGLNRLDYPEHGSVGWAARVYSGGKEYTRFFSDSVYNGPEQALRSAVAWRAAQRKRTPPTVRQPTPRILRVERPEWKNVGYFAWRDGRRRYFSDSRHGGPGGARMAAEEWAELRQA